MLHSEEYKILWKEEKWGRGTTDSAQNDFVFILIFFNYSFFEAFSWFFFSFVFPGKGSSEELVSQIEVVNCFPINIQF